MEQIKARLVAKGFMHMEGVDYSKVFATVSKHTSLTTLLAVATKLVQAKKDKLMHREDYHYSELVGS